MEENQALQESAREAAAALSAAEEELGSARGCVEELEHALTCPVCMRSKS